MQPKWLQRWIMGCLMLSTFGSLRKDFIHKKIETELREKIVQLESELQKLRSE